MKKIIIPFLVTAVLVIVVFLLFENIEQYFTDLLNGSASQKRNFALLSFLVLTSDIVLPVPSSIVMYSNGFVLGLVLGMALSLVSAMMGTVFGYYLGRFTSWGLKARADQKADLFLNKYGAVAILVSRGIPILSESVCIVCGYNKMKTRSYLLFNFIGYIPVCLLYAYFGSIAYNKNSFLISFACSLVISGLFFFVGKKYFKSI